MCMHSANYATVLILVHMCAANNVQQCDCLHVLYFMCSDAVQMIFSMHCCLHLVGQPVSVGRLDQLLIGYYQTDIEKKRITPERV